MWDIKLEEYLIEFLDKMYYLNHVGYKGTIWEVGWRKFNSIIWTMWDIKKVGFTRYGHPSHMYYLNHVGYKDIKRIIDEIEKDETGIIWTMWDIKAAYINVENQVKIVLSEPCGI